MLQQDHRWPGLRSIVKVESRRELLVEDKVETETLLQARCRRTPSRSATRYAATGASRMGCTG